MSTLSPILQEPAIVYPESDGLPLSDNTKQFRWIMTIKGGLEAVFLDDPNVFVAGNLLWYPIEGNNKIRTAPDIFVVVGRPKGDRGSYQQWLENNIPPQVTFEIVSPGNSAGVLTKKFNFYDQFGVNEYYLYDPDTNSLDGWLRKSDRLTEISQMNGWVSPLLGIKFDLTGNELTIHEPKGQAFVDTAEAIKQRDQLRLEKDRALQLAEKRAAQLKALGVEPEA